jgi:hypothetical protein
VKVTGFIKRGVSEGDKSVNPSEILSGQNFKLFSGRNFRYSKSRLKLIRRHLYKLLETIPFTEVLEVNPHFSAN